MKNYSTLERPPSADVCCQNTCRYILTTDSTGSRRFVCVYADEIDNSGLINYDMLYAQLYAELEQGRRYWFEDEENAR